MQRRSQRSVTEMRRTLASLNRVSGPDRSAAEDLAEDAARRHDAVAGQMIDGAPRVAVLADLADPQPHRAGDDEYVADREGREIEPACRQVLGEGARTDRHGRAAGPLALGLDVLDGQERDLPVAEVPVGVAGDAPSGFDL